MTLSIDQLKQIAKDFVQKESPDLAALEPTHEEEVRSVDPGAMRKLGLRQPHSIPSKVNVFTFRSAATAADGATIPIVTRITVDEDGNVLKATGN
jgi:hypothetical protein